MFVLLVNDDMKSESATLTGDIEGDGPLDLPALVFEEEGRLNFSRIGGRRREIFGKEDDRLLEVVVLVVVEVLPPPLRLPLRALAEVVFRRRRRPIEAILSSCFLLRFQAEWMNTDLSSRLSRLCHFILSLGARDGE